MASDVARYYRIIFNKGQVRLAHGLENNDNICHDLSVSMVIEGFHTTELYFLLKVMLQCSIDNLTILSYTERKQLVFD